MKKFGISLFIVNETVLQICSMKPVDWQDLVQLDMEAEIALTNMVTEIERKLPNPQPNKDWMVGCGEKLQRNVWCIHEVPA